MRARLTLLVIAAVALSACATPIVIPYEDNGVATSWDSGVQRSDSSAADRGLSRPDGGVPPLADGAVGDANFTDGDMSLGDGDMGDAGVGDGATPTGDGASDTGAVRVDGAWLD